MSLYIDLLITEDSLSHRRSNLGPSNFSFIKKVSKVLEREPKEGLLWHSCWYLAEMCPDSVSVNNNMLHHINWWKGELMCWQTQFDRCVNVHLFKSLSSEWKYEVVSNKMDHSYIIFSFLGHDLHKLRKPYLFPCAQLYNSL